MVKRKRLLLVSLVAWACGNGGATDDRRIDAAGTHADASMTDVSGGAGSGADSSGAYDSSGADRSSGADLNDGATMTMMVDAADASGGREGGLIDAYVADRPPNAPGVLIHVVNGCSFDLYIHGAGGGATLMPDNVKLAAGGGSQDYTAPDNWPAARVTAYLDGPQKNELDKVEMTIANKVINYNITYVDWVGLPVEMIAFGSGSDCKRVGCYGKQSDLLSSCPAGLLSGKKCISAYGFCASADNANSALCHALDGQFAKCASLGCPMGTTTQVYGCSGPYANDPKWCAALNRGRPMNPDDPDASLYYTTPPYNIYAKWVHDTCPGIYAFAYDDYGKSNQSSFHACTGGTQLNITFCPSG
jgi:hypothetical protein